MKRKIGQLPVWGRQAPSLPSSQLLSRRLSPALSSLLFSLVLTPSFSVQAATQAAPVDTAAPNTSALNTVPPDAAATPQPLPDSSPSNPAISPANIPAVSQNDAPVAAPATAAPPRGFFAKIWQRFRPSEDNPDSIVLQPTIRANIEGAPDALALNLKSYLQRLTVEELATFRDTLPRMRSLARDAAQAVGYYNAQFRFSAVNKTTLRVEVTAGEPVMLAAPDIQILGDGRNDSAFSKIAADQDVIEGERLDHSRYEKTKNRIAALATERGYFDGGWLAHEVLVTLPDNRADVKLHYQTAERYRFGAVDFLTTTGRSDSTSVNEKPVTDANAGADGRPLPVRLALFQQLLLFAQHDPYDATQVSELSKNLLDTRWFNSIEIEAITPETDPMLGQTTSRDAMRAAQQIDQKNAPENQAMAKDAVAKDAIDHAASSSANAESNPESNAATKPQDKLDPPNPIDNSSNNAEQNLGQSASATAQRVGDQANPSLAQAVQTTQAKIDAAERSKEIPIRVKVDARNPNSAEVGIGYGTDTNIRLRTQYRRALMSDKGDSVDANLELSRIRQAVDARYTRPFRHPLNDTLSYVTGFESETRMQGENNLDLKTQSLTLGAERAIKASRDQWQRTYSLRYRIDQLKNNNSGASAEVLADLPEPFNLQGISQTQQSLLVGLSFNKVKTEGGLDPIQGFRQYYQIDVGSKQVFTDVDLAILRTGWRLIHSVGDTNQHRFTGRADLGAILTSQFSKVPYNLRFFAGGDQSIRGYDYKSLSTLTDGYLIGGQNLAIASLEYSYRFLPKWRAAVFADAGNAFDEKFNDPINVGAGLGIRWTSPVGPIRIDVAAGVSEPSIPIRLHFFIGPAL